MLPIKKTRILRWLGYLKHVNYKDFNTSVCNNKITVNLHTCIYIGMNLPRVYTSDPLCLEDMSYSMERSLVFSGRSSLST